jgi:glycosyltransferase involved in cell wall biosynthesis
MQIGTNETLKTYPKHIHNKIILIRQSSTIAEKLNIQRDYSNKVDFIWFGGTGSLLKGLHITLEYFFIHQNLNLHVVGPVDKKFKTILESYIGHNIFFYGFLDINSSLCFELFKKCNFLIYPSGSEGGIPGSVINCMRYGIIPIVSKWCSFNEFDEYGYVLRNLDIESLEECLNKVKELSAEQINIKSIFSREFSFANFNMNIFKEDSILFELIITFILLKIINKN